MKLGVFIKRALGINEYPSMLTGGVEEVAEDAARARVRLGQAMDDWTRLEVRLRERRKTDRPQPADVFGVRRYFPQADFIRDKDPGDAGR